MDTYGGMHWRQKWPNEITSRDTPIDAQLMFAQYDTTQKA